MSSEDRSKSRSRSRDPPKHEKKESTVSSKDEPSNKEKDRYDMMENSMQVVRIRQVMELYQLLITSNTNWNHLREIFGNYGVVKRVKIQRRDSTMISQGIGFVEMSSQEEANLAMDYLDGSQIDGVKVFVYQVYRSPFAAEDRKQRSEKRARSHSRSRSRTRDHSSRHRDRSSTRSSHHHHHHH